MYAVIRSMHIIHCRLVRQGCSLKENEADILALRILNGPPSKWYVYPPQDTF